MWITTPYGFFSIVRAHAPDTLSTDLNPKPHSTLYMFRARKHGHLEELKRRVGHTGKIVVNEGTDYPYRLFVEADDLQKMTAAMTEAVDYTNFKAEAKRQSPKDSTFHAFLVAVWSAGLALTPARVRRGQRQGRASVVGSFK